MRTGTAKVIQRYDAIKFEDDLNMYLGEGYTLMSSNTAAIKSESGGFNNDFTAILVKYEEPVGEWIKIEDSLPTNESKIFLYNGHDINIGWAEQGDVNNLYDKFYYYSHGGVKNLHGVTHWMPLISPPSL